MYAEERLKSEIIQEAMQKKVVKPSQRREMAQHMVVTFWDSLCRATALRESHRNEGDVLQHVVALKSDYEDDKDSI
ncbi:Uncharacterised protein [Yersinia pseudotuberculosis]|uniref:Uncharacterized protein n=1 Tax=Yersinia pseudotuberculosis TaxID=633 RepID=A0A380Q3E5_YERPU|nr:Uncharacterised protein [Yersinia pseudotuberculosis]